MKRKEKRVVLFEQPFFIDNFWDIHNFTKKNSIDTKTKTIEREREREREREK